MEDQASPASTSSQKRRKLSNGSTRPEAEKMSVGEQIISQFLDELKVKYLFDCNLNLVGVKNGSLRFDFCIPIDQELEHRDVRNCLLLEYNGIFHYHTISGKTTLYTLTKQQMNDFLKAKFAFDNDLKILWIPYWMQIKDVKKTIKTFLIQNGILADAISTPRGRDNTNVE